MILRHLDYQSGLLIAMMKELDTSRGGGKA